LHAILIVLLSTLVGTALSAVLACLPGLHAYNVLGALMLALYWLADNGHLIAPEWYLPFATGMIVGWAMLNTIPAALPVGLFWLLHKAVTGRRASDNALTESSDEWIDPMNG
jgi:hypothetical protein